MDIEEILKSSGHLDESAAREARRLARQKRIRFEEALVESGAAPEAVVYKAAAKAAGLPFVDPSKGRIPSDVVELVRPHLQVFREHRALPVLLKEGRLYVAVDDPVRTFVADDLGFLVGREVVCAVAPPRALDRAMEELARRAGGEGSPPPAEGSGGGPRPRGAAGGGEDEDAPIIRLVESSFREALQMRASDIHVEPFEDRVRIRYRVDGVLRTVADHPAHLHGPLVSRLKIMAGLDIAEKRKPQDGRILVHVDGRPIDVRTSVLPTNHGETVVMRLLDREANLLSLEALGFHPDDYAWFRRIIKRPHGIFLVTGPTGSGKTTTLYAALSELNRPDVKIITAEDPVEYHIQGINQCQVRHNIGLTFAKILRSMLRQAPNIILVGEIRDRETAEIAVQAALTGHLVFSTLHTNDAPSALTRLIDMGIKPFLVAASVQAVMAQRLVRTLCPRCKEAYEPAPSELESIGLTPADAEGKTLYRPVGCPACEGTGYKGRKGIFELMEMDGSLRDMVFRKEPTHKLARYAVSSGGMNTLLEDGARKVLAGETSIAEVLRVTVQA